MPSGSLPLLVFDLGETRCALPAAAIREILPVPRLSRPPGCPAAIAGFANLGGKPLPVLALSRILGLPASEPADVYSHVLVLKGGDPPLGLLVARAEDVVTAWRDSIEPARDADALAGCIAGTLPSVGRLVYLIDADSILSARERTVVAEQAEREANRLDVFAATAE